MGPLIKSHKIKRIGMERPLGKGTKQVKNYIVDVINGVEIDVNKKEIKLQLVIL